jgi:hypothetical protein
MKQPSTTPGDVNERLWRGLLFGFSAMMGAFALVDLEAGRVANAAGDAGVVCLMLSLMHQFPLVRSIISDAAKKKVSAAEMQRQTERIRVTHPWSERMAAVGWTLLFGSLILRAMGVE